MTDYTKEIHERADYCDRVCMNDTARMLREYACLLERTPESETLRAAKSQPEAFHPCSDSGDRT